ncbi:hypothetical protein [Zavarzinia sp.]|uniref:hypothetical protein n=1 Tax=Zavarzinia sp. TaxID=2027920 RepID=UPI0035679C10
MPAAKGHHRPGLLPAACGLVLMLAAPGAALAGSTAAEAVAGDLSSAPVCDEIRGTGPGVRHGAGRPSRRAGTRRLS